MPILVTGATGLAGRHLTRFCAAEGTEVAGTGRRPGDQVGPLKGLTRYLELDLLDADHTRRVVDSTRPDRVFHLAAEASVPESWQSPRRTLETNLIGTFNLLDAIKDRCPQARVLVACSGDEYGTVPPSRLPITERTSLKPLSPYAVSKAAVDVLAGFFADAHGLDVVRTRAFNHAGPGQSDRYVIGSFARQIAEAEAHGAQHAELVTGNLEVRRDFTDVRDVVRGYWLALESAPRGVFNVCSGHSTRLADLLDQLGKHARIPVNQRTDPDRLRKGEVMDLFGSHERLTAATGWRPVLPLETTLRDTLDWWRSQLEARES
jgi:GDP-4-dehydro-6-deoxy-D-mannose reductase